MLEIIYHVTTPEYYKEFENEDHFYPLGYKYEGFIHCSYDHQLPYVMSKYYKNEEDIILLKLDTSKIEAELKVEMATVGERFPHIYGVINKSAIIKEKRMKNEFFQWD